MLPFYNASRFKETLHQILPDEKDIKVTPTDNDNVTLSGKRLKHFQPFTGFSVGRFLFSKGKREGKSD